MLAQHSLPAQVVIIADRELLLQRAQSLKQSLKTTEFSPGVRAQPASGELLLRHVEIAAPVMAGKTDPANSAYVLRTLEVAADGCRSGLFDAMTTAPVHKAVINAAGLAFTGHTEFLAAHTATPQVVMMLAGGGMRVALATTHLALKDVPGGITRAGLEQTLRIVQRDLIERFAIARPRIAVAGLNPHAGEEGYLGREEIDVIAPVLAALRKEGFELTGPLPADTLFHPDRLKSYDCVLAMYHDQGLPVLKYASFGSGVNVTLGLPIIRTSVDHGTALELAGTGKAEVGSLIEAIRLAAELVAHEKRRSALQA